MLSLRTATLIFNDGNADVIMPPNYRPSMTFEEARNAYLEDGLAPTDAEVYARVLTSPPIDGLPIA